MKKITLKACPFCGEYADMFTESDLAKHGLGTNTEQFYVGCSDCSIYFKERSQHKAIDRWNKRV